jgi:hypothetical protein
MRFFLTIVVAAMTAISITLDKKQSSCDLTCDFLLTSDCDVTLSRGQSACCGNGEALHCYEDGIQGVDSCDGDSFCEMFTSGSIRDCRCGT